jgi:hypothetical protein
MASRDHVFTVVAGTVPGRWGYLVKMRFADGTTTLYDPSEGKTWAFVLQRCGDVAKTQPVSVSLIHPRHHVVATRQIATSDSTQQIATECASSEDR